MYKRTLAVILLIGLIICIIQCSSSTGPEDDADSELNKLLNLTPRVDREAELAALWLSGDLVAPESLYLQIRDAYSQIRSEYNSFFLIQRRIGFEMQETESHIILHLDNNGVDLIRAGTHSDFNKLNQQLRTTELDTSNINNSEDPYIEVYFNGRLNPDRLIEYYQDVNFIISVEVPENSDPGSNFYPWYVDGELVFLLYNSGYPGYVNYKYEQYYYFKPDNDSYYFVGVFDLVDEVIPEWWDEIKYVRCAFMGLGDNACDAYDWLYQYGGEK